MGRPAYSIPKATRIPVPAVDPVSSVEYSPRLDFVRQGAPKCVFSKDKRSADRQSTVPGPGAYEQGVIARATPAYTFPRNALHTSPTAVPGPGTYNVPACIAQSHKGFSIPQQNRGVSAPRTGNNCTPGPGQYEVCDTLMTSRCGVFSFKRGKAKASPNDAELGPGAYNIIENRKLRGGAIDRAVEKPPSHTAPGPGAYNIDHYSVLRKSNPAPSIRASRRSTERASFTPGPGTYEPVDRWTRPHSPRLNFAKAPRCATTASDAPGPGAYDPQLLRPRANIVFGKENRESLNAPKDAPSPGHYEIPSALSQQGRTFPRATYHTRAAPFKVQNSVQPHTRRLGSGHRKTVTTEPAELFRAAEQLDVGQNTTQKANQRPISALRSGMITLDAPHSERNHLLQSSYNYGSSKKVRMHTRASQVGRSTRHSASRASNTNRESNNESSFQPQEEGTPGPGAYNPFYKAKFCLGKFGKAPRDAQRAEDIFRGPAMYQPAKPDFSPAWTFPRGRKPDSATVHFPGPGAYELTDFLHDHPQYVLSKLGH